MKWQIDEIMKLESHKLNPFSDDYVSRDEVVELLSRKCRDCKFYEKRREKVEYVQGRPVRRSSGYGKVTECCTNAVKVWKKSERYTGGSNDACARFERGE